MVTAMWSVSKRTGPSNSKSAVTSTPRPSSCPVALWSVQTLNRKPYALPLRPEERDQLVDLRLLLEPDRDIPAAARLGPVDIALLMAASGRHHRGRELRPARRAIGDVVRKPDLVEAAHGSPPVSAGPQGAHAALVRRPALT